MKLNHIRWLKESAIKPTPKQVASARAYIKQYVPDYMTRAALSSAKQVKDPAVIDRLKYCYEILRAVTPGLSISSMPAQFITPEMCWEDVSRVWQAFEDVPNHCYSTDLCMLAVEGSGNALEWVPDQYQTKEMVERAVGEYPEMLAAVNPKLLTRELCWLAVERDGDAIQYVPNRFRDEELMVAAVLNNPSAITHIPWEQREEVLQQVKLEKESATTYSSSFGQR